MNQNNKYLKSSFWYVVATFISSIIAILTTPIFSRLLTIEEYGVVDIYGTWITVMTVILTLNACACIQIVKTYHENDSKEYTATVLTMSSVTTTVLFVGVFVVNLKMHFIDLDNKLLLIMYFEVLTKNIFNIWLTYKKAFLSYKSFTLISVIVALLAPIISVVLISSFEFGAYGKIIGHMAPYTVVSLFLLKSIYMESNGVFCRRYLGEILSYCLPLIPHSLAGFLLSGSDKLIINKLEDIRAVSFYGRGYAFCSLLLYFFSTINGAIVPWLFDKLKENDVDEIRKITKVLNICFLFLTICMIGIGPEAILLLTSKKYYNARWVLPPILVGIYMNYLYTYYVNVEFFYKKTVHIATGTIVSGILNVILNFVFISKYGYVAAAYTTLFSYFALFIFHFCISKRIDARDMFNDKANFISCIFVVLIGGVLFSFYDKLLIRYGVLLILTILFVLVFIRKYGRDIKTMFCMYKR